MPCVFFCLSQDLSTESDSIMETKDPDPFFPSFSPPSESETIREKEFPGVGLNPPRPREASFMEEPLPPEASFKEEPLQPEASFQGEIEAPGEDRLATEAAKNRAEEEEAARRKAEEEEEERKRRADEDRLATEAAKKRAEEKEAAREKAEAEAAARKKDEENETARQKEVTTVLKSCVFGEFL